MIHNAKSFENVDNNQTKMRTKLHHIESKMEGIDSKMDNMVRLQEQLLATLLVEKH